MNKKRQLIRRALIFVFFLFFPVTIFYFSPYLIVMGASEGIAIVVLSFTTGKRGFCYYVCWMAPFMVIGTKISSFLKLPLLRLKSDKDKCINCKACTKNCPMSLDVMDMVQRGSMQNSECILCGMCVDVCPKDVIKYKM